MENKEMRTTGVCPKQVIVCPVGERECDPITEVIENGCRILCNVQQLVERTCTVRNDDACVCFDGEVLEILSCNACVLDSCVSTEQPELEECITVANVVVTVQVLVEARVRRGIRECIDVAKTIVTVEIPRILEGCELQRVSLTEPEAICETGPFEPGTCQRIPVRVCVRVLVRACLLRREVRIPPCPPVAGAQNKGFIC